MVINMNKIPLGYLMHQLVKNHLCFRDHLCLQHQSNDATVCPDRPAHTHAHTRAHTHTHITAKSLCLNLSVGQLGTSVLDRQADPLKPDVKSIRDTHAWSSQRSLVWHSRDLKQGTTPISAPLSWIRQHDIIWTM
jgi:hypothetical protein